VRSPDKEGTVGEKFVVRRRRRALNLLKGIDATPGGLNSSDAERRSSTNPPTMRSLAFFFALFCGVISVPAESLVLAENGMTSQIARDYWLFRIKHGKEPKNWGEIESFTGRPLNEAYKTLQPTTRYAFLEKPLPIEFSNGKGRIVILSRSPAHDQYAMRGFFGPITGSLKSNLMRYAIVVSEDGFASSFPFRETRIQKMFADAGVALPSPDPLGPRPYEQANRISLIIWIGCALVIGGFAANFVAKRILPYFDRD